MGHEREHELVYECVCHSLPYGLAGGLADWLIGCLSGICFLGAMDGIPSLPRSLAPAGVPPTPLREVVQCSHPKRSHAGHAVPIVRVLARLLQVVPALVALRAGTAPEEPWSFLA